MSIAQRLASDYINAGATAVAAKFLSATLTPTQAANTSADGLILTDTTAATAANQQYSPRVRWTGQGWKTNATAGSQTVDFIAEVQPVQGAAAPTNLLIFSGQTNAGGYTNIFAIDGTNNRISPASGGTFTLYASGFTGNRAINIGNNLGNSNGGIALLSTYALGWTPTDASLGTGSVQAQLSMPSSGSLSIDTGTKGNGLGSLILAGLTASAAVAIGNSVNAVSPTSPNRTVTMVVGGVTLYLAAKTTND